MKSKAQSAKPIQPPWAHLRLPPFPLVAIRVMQLTNNENVQLHQLSELIATDAAFAAEVLSIANSLVYAPRYPAVSILHAIAVMGASQLRGMCLTVGVRSYLGKWLNHPVIRGVWRHNLACGVIAGQIAAAGFMDKDSAYTAGVLHDIGRLALAVIRPEEYAALLKQYHGTAGSILAHETAIFGFDHCQAGRHLVADWMLPADFDDIVANHHAPRRADGAWDMAELIRIGCKLADAVGFPAFPGCAIMPFDALRDELPARERRAFPATMETVAEEVSRRIAALEAI